MASHWLVFYRLSEMMAWWRELDAGLPAEDRDHRAMALLLRSEAARPVGEWEEVNVYSAQALALADPHSWVSVDAQAVQAFYWSEFDPPRGDRLFREVFEIEGRMGLLPDPVADGAYYLSRLRRTSGHDEAFALLHEWLTNLGDSSPLYVLAAFALYGDTRTALELQTRGAAWVPPDLRESPFAALAETPRVPSAQQVVELVETVLASAQGQFDEAEQHLATAASVVRDFAVPRGEAGCLVGFAKIAIDRGDYVRASRLLASVGASVGPQGSPFQNPLPALVYDLCIEALGDVLDPETARTTQAEGAALSLKDALNAELMRSAMTATTNPADTEAATH
jgi:hypothetical protein